MRLIILLLLTSPLIGQTLQQNIKFMALGDSYTIGESVTSSGRWPNQLMDSLESRGYTIEKNNIIAQTGWTTTNLLNAIDAAQPDNNYNLVSVLIGVNNFFQGKPVGLYRNELKTLINTALDLCNNDTNALFLVTIPDYGYTPFGQSSQASVSADTDLYNAIKDSIAATYNIPVFNITPISRRGINEPNLVAIDNLHPSAEQYTLWVEQILANWTTTNNRQLLKFTASMQASYVGNVFNFQANEGGELSIFDTTGKLLQTLQVKSNEHVSVFCENKSIVATLTCSTKQYSEVFVQ